MLTSATLSVANKLNYYVGRVGFEGATLVLDSPFDYQRQVKIHIPAKIPAPREEGHEEAVAAEIERYITMTHGKAFVLFTSYDAMITAADMTRPVLREEGHHADDPGRRNQALGNAADVPGGHRLGDLRDH